MSVSIIIPNWNGKRLLEKNLPAVINTEADEIIVVDNGSTDSSVEFVRQMQNKNSMVRTIELKKNYGFSYACNLGVKEAKSEVVVLLNNDVVPKKDFLFSLVEDFQDENVFAVSLGEPQWSWAKGEWVKGFVEHMPGIRTENPHISFWASGGSGAFRKSIWNKLGGFDEIFNPFYWEDVDLSYRAWKRGYKILWEPKSIVYHKHEGTISRFPKDYIRLISERNQLLFIWKNITSPKMMFEHKLNLIKRLLTHPGYWKPFGAAMLKWPQVLQRKFVECWSKKVSDQNVFSQFNP